MKASLINRHGGSEELRYEDVAKPVPGPGQVLIRVAAVGVNPADYKHRCGMFKDFIPYEFPKILGYDVAGTVEELGEGVSAPAVGTSVLAMLDPMLAGGAYAEYVVTEAAGCGLIPQAMDVETAAGIPCPGLTGVQMIEEHLKPKAGDRVLVTGATGMVGRFVTTAAKDAGAHVIAAVRPEYADEARAFGADEVIDLGAGGYEGEPFDGVIDTVGGPAVTALASHTKPGGRIITVATDPLDPSQLPSEPEFLGVHPDGARLTRLAETVSEGKVPVPIAARFPLSEAGKAHARQEAGGVKGKIVLLVD